MGSLQIVANEREYRIFDVQEQQMLVTGIESFKVALVMCDRLHQLKESVARFTRAPCRSQLTAA